MLRKYSMVAAILLLCLPIGGMLTIPVPAVAASAQPASQITSSPDWLLGIREMVMLCGCLAVLSLTSARKWL